MATKKEKRERSLAKREAFLAEIKASGLRAQAEDRQQQKERSERFAAEARKANQRLETILAMHGIAFPSDAPSK